MIYIYMIYTYIYICTSRGTPTWRYPLSHQGLQPLQRFAHLLALPALSDGCTTTVDAAPLLVFVLLI